MVRTQHLNYSAPGSIPGRGNRFCKPHSRAENKKLSKLTMSRRIMSSVLSAYVVTCHPRGDDISRNGPSHPQAMLAIGGTEHPQHAGFLQAALLDPLSRGLPVFVCLKVGSSSRPPPGPDLLFWPERPGS